MCIFTMPMSFRTYKIKHIDFLLGRFLDDFKWHLFIGRSYDSLANQREWEFGTLLSMTSVQGMLLSWFVEGRNINFEVIIYYLASLWDMFYANNCSQCQTGDSVLPKAEIYLCRIVECFSFPAFLITLDSCQCWDTYH